MLQIKSVDWKSLVSRRSQNNEVIFIRLLTKNLLQGITMDDSSVEVDESVLTTHQFVQQPQQIILGDSQSAASTIQVKADVMKTEPQMRKIGQPQIKFVSKEGSGAIRIAPSNIQGEIDFCSSDGQRKLSGCRAKVITTKSLSKLSK